MILLICNRIIVKNVIEKFAAYTTYIKSKFTFLIMNYYLYIYKHEYIIMIYNRRNEKIK